MTLWSSKPTFEPDFKYSSLDEAVATRTVNLNAGEYSATLPRDWCIGFILHGGYLTALLIHAGTKHMTTHPKLSKLNQPHPIHSAVTFLSRCTPGPAKLVATVLKTGRQYTFLRVSLYQNILRLEANIVFTHMAEHQRGPTLRTLPPPPPPPHPDGPWDIIGGDPLNNVRPVSKKLHYRTTPGSHFGSDRKSSPSVREEWVRMADGSKFSIPSLGYLSDMFLPLPENYPEVDKAQWYPTLALSVEVKRAPEGGGWDVLFRRVQSRVIENGRMDMTVDLFDEQGRIVAISHHVAIMVSAERNWRKAAAKL
ncbi:thioesterase-like superfamily-domain-containing protein [Tuber brumale]|nr:thioesterase-like superfamily-domain-containing protein [Tuber brumale]